MMHWEAIEKWEESSDRVPPRHFCHSILGAVCATRIQGGASKIKIMCNNICDGGILLTGSVFIVIYRSIITYKEKLYYTKRFQAYCNKRGHSERNENATLRMT